MRCSKSGAIPFIVWTAAQLQSSNWLILRLCSRKELIQCRNGDDGPVYRVLSQWFVCWTTSTYLRDSRVKWNNRVFQTRIQGSQAQNLPDVGDLWLDVPRWFYAYQWLPWSMMLLQGVTHIVRGGRIFGINPKANYLQATNCFCHTRVCTPIPIATI